MPKTRTIFFRVPKSSFEYEGATEAEREDRRSYQISAIRMFIETIGGEDEVISALQELKAHHPGGKRHPRPAQITILAAVAEASGFEKAMLHYLQSRRDEGLIDETENETLHGGQ